MATFSLPSTQPRATFITSTMYAALGSWRRPPTCRVRRNTSQSINSATPTPIQWNVEDWDTNTMWSSTASPKLYARTAGKYLVTVTGGWASSTGGTYRGAVLRKNSTAASASPNEAAFYQVHDMISNVKSGALSSIVNMSTGDFLTVHLDHDAGAALGLSTSFHFTCSMLWVST